MRFDVIMAGGGRAGLSVAVALADAGLRLQVPEAGGAPGGRARSRDDPHTGDGVDGAAALSPASRTMERHARAPAMSRPPHEPASPWRSGTGGSRRDDRPGPAGGASDAPPGESRADDAPPRGPYGRPRPGTADPGRREGPPPRVGHAEPRAPRQDEARQRPGGHRGHAALHEATGQAKDAAGTAPRAEVRLYGLNAVRAVFARRPGAIRKVYVAEARIPALQPLLKWCAANRVGYRVVGEGDLQKLAASAHHEGVVADVLREEPMPLSTWLRDLPEERCCAIWLDGVGNPHNFGAILRSAAHFGVGAILLPKDAPLALSGAAARVAEGGAEAVPLVRLGRADNALAQLRGAGFALAATLVDGGEDAFATPLPARLVYVMGAEGGGMDRAFADACDLRLSIPGSGAVESLNVAAATAVFLAAWARGAPG